MRLSEWTLLFLGFVFSQCILDTYGDNTAIKKEINSGLKLQLPMPMPIIQHGYPAETHTVTTADGYILTMHRIPYSPTSTKTGTQRPVVFLQHGLLCSSVDWVIMGPGKALAYLLSDAGYDVWMGNARGNVYSSRHESLSNSSSKFWAFSWHEMGVYDLPAVIDYILHYTAQKNLYYVGHSMGSTMFFVLMSTKPEYNAKIRHMVALAPVAFLRNTKSLFAVATKFVPKGLLTELLYNRPFFPYTKYITGPLRTLCKTGAITQGLCTNILFQIGGFNSNQINQTFVGVKGGWHYIGGTKWGLTVCSKRVPIIDTTFLRILHECIFISSGSVLKGCKPSSSNTMLPIIFTYFPAGSSLKAWTHYGQLMRSGLFRQYDYGFIKNVFKYGNNKPPEYNLAAITSTVSLIVGPNDWLATPEDAGLLYKSLPSPTKYYTVEHSDFNHFDFLWAIDVKTLVNEKVLHLLKYNADMTIENNMIINY